MAHVVSLSGLFSFEKFGAEFSSKFFFYFKVGNVGTLNSLSAKTQSDKGITNRHVHAGKFC